MAITWPSIIPDGRDHVGPGVGLGHRRRRRRARGWRRCRPRRRRRRARSGRGRCTRRGTGRPSATMSSPTASRSSRRATCTMPSGSQAPEPSRVLGGGDAEEDDAGHAEVDSCSTSSAQRRRACAGPPRAATGWAGARRCPRGRRGGRSGRRPRGGSRPRAGAGRGCGAAGGGGVGGSSSTSEPTHDVGGPDPAGVRWRRRRGRRPARPPCGRRRRRPPAARADGRCRR